MRTLTLTTENDFDSRSILLAVVRAPIGGGQQGGTSVETMRRDIRLLDVLEPAKPGEDINLEEADWAHLKMKVETFPFAVSDRRIVALVDAVAGAQTVA